MKEDENYKKYWKRARFKTKRTRRERKSSLHKYSAIRFRLNVFLLVNFRLEHRVSLFSLSIHSSISFLLSFPLNMYPCSYHRGIARLSRRFSFNIVVFYSFSDEQIYSLQSVDMSPTNTRTMISHTIPFIFLIFSLANSVESSSSMLENKSI